jgi:hypothetical protein
VERSISARGGNPKVETVGRALDSHSRDGGRAPEALNPPVQTNVLPACCLRAQFRRGEAQVNGAD